MAVVATTSVIIAVFLPIAFLKGTVGQFFKQFGMTVCFAMAISLFEAMVMGPMLSAYWAKKRTGGKHDKPKGILKWFDNLQTLMEKGYEILIGWSIRHRLFVVIGAVVIFILSLGLTKFIKFTFLPAGDNGEFRVTLKLPPSSSLETTRDASHKVIDIIKAHKEILLTSETIGDTQGNDNTSTIYAKLTPWQKRKLSTSDLKEIVRKELEPYREQYQPQVADYDLVNNAAPFNLVLVGDDYKRWNLWRMS
jgi:HAE1 family hydrophobic/amphiphilic exporter-1